MKTFHSAPLINISTHNYKCSACASSEISFKKKPEILKHFNDRHDIKVISESKTFDTFEIFMEWKSKFEKTNVSKYNLMFGSDKYIPNISGCASKKTLYYSCHRSGYFSSKGKGVRHLKTQGSKKIDGYCPSQMKVTINENGKCIVDYVPTHVGHEGELAHLFLTTEERASIAAKIAAKVPFDDILDEVRDNVSNIERINLLTKKDLHNLEASFNSNAEAVRHSNDAISVDA